MGRVAAPRRAQRGKAAEMEIRASYLLVGAVVLALVAGLAAFSVWLVKADIDGQGDPYQIAFAGSVTGLQQGSQVRYRGVPVGRVTDVRIDPERVEWVLVTVEIDRGTPIRQDTVASLEMQGITGIAFVQLRGGTQASPPLAATAGQTLPQIEVAAIDDRAAVRIDARSPGALARPGRAGDRAAGRSKSAGVNQKPAKH